MVEEKCFCVRFLRGYIQVEDLCSIKLKMQLCFIEIQYKSTLNYEIRSQEYIAGKCWGTHKLKGLNPMFQLQMPQASKVEG